MASVELESSRDDYRVKVDELNSELMELRKKVTIAITLYTVELSDYHDMMIVLTVVLVEHYSGTPLEGHPLNCRHLVYDGH